jgi:hypothetical protein
MSDAPRPLELDAATYVDEDGEAPRSAPRRTGVRTMARKILILVACAALIAPAAAVGLTSTAGPDTRTMVLARSDMPAGFGRDSANYLKNAALARDGVYKKSGRVIGYEADFSRGGLLTMASVLSVASLYKSDAGAHASYASALASVRRRGYKRLSLGAPLGNEAVFYVGEHENDGITVSAYAIIWRWGRVKASLGVGGLAGYVDPAGVVDLARKQQARIAAATDL